MRARKPDSSGRVERDGVGIHWERFGDGEPAILLMPTWSIIPSRHWKVQIPYLARYHRVVTFDGRGSGASDRPKGPRCTTPATNTSPTRWPCSTPRQPNGPCSSRSLERAGGPGAGCRSR